MRYWHEVLQHLFIVDLLLLSVEVFEFDYRVGVSVAYVLVGSFHFVGNHKFTFRVAQLISWR